MSQYMLKTGSDAAPRLDAVEAMFGAASREFLLSAGLHAGDRVLDVGCGTGTLTCWIAQAVGPQGQVLGVDARGEQLEVARKNAERAGLQNTQFIQRSLGVDALPDRGFDLVHCRLLLMHLSDPASALGAMARAVRAGGLLVCEETSAASTFTSPAISVIEKLNELFRDAGKARGLDFDIGDKLLALVSQHATLLAGSRFIQPMVSLAEAKRFLLLAAQELKPALLAMGMMTEAQATEYESQLQAIPHDPTAYYAPARLAQVAGMVTGHS